MIELIDVWKSYGAVNVLKGATLIVEEGKPLCLLGKSGCGKSTLLKLMALITRPDKGKILFDGKDLAIMTDAEMNQSRREKISYTFQEPLLMPYLSALENVSELTGVPKVKAIEVLTRLGLGDRLNHRPSKLSGGEKKRVDIARAMLRCSPVMVADEPLSNLDSETGKNVMELLKERADGGILIYSSVEPTETKYASRVINMEKR